MRDLESTIEKEIIYISPQMIFLLTDLTNAIHRLIISYPAQSLDSSEEISQDEVLFKKNIQWERVLKLIEDIKIQIRKELIDE